MKPDLIEEIARVIEAALCADAGRNQGAIWRSERGCAQMFVSATAIAPIIDRLTAEARANALDEAAGVCANYMADCLDDKDVRKRWPEILARNKTYAKLVFNLKGTDNG